MAQQSRSTANDDLVTVKPHEQGGFAVYVDGVLATRSANEDTANDYAERLRADGVTMIGEPQDE